MTDDLPFHYPDEAPASGTGSTRRAKPAPTREASRRSRNNRKRGSQEEAHVAAVMGGRKVGQLNLPWDVEVPGYARIQCKKLDRWPSLTRVLEWLDAMPAGTEMRVVTIADTPGPGKLTRRIAVLDLDDLAAWHGRKGG